MKIENRSRSGQLSIEKRFQDNDPHKPSYYNLFLYIPEYPLYFHFQKLFPR